MINLGYFSHPTCYQSTVNHMFQIQGEVGTLERKEKITIQDPSTLPSRTYSCCNYVSSTCHCHLMSFAFYLVTYLAGMYTWQSGWHVHHRSLDRLEFNFIESSGGRWVFTIPLLAREILSWGRARVKVLIIMIIIEPIICYLNWIHPCLIKLDVLQIDPLYA
jgi:hypothetical protein